MDARPEDVKRSGQGKMAAATQAQSAQNLKPLFKLLRNRVSHSSSKRSKCHRTDAAELRTGCAAWSRRDCPLHADPVVSEGERLVPATIDRNGGLAHRRDECRYSRAIKSGQAIRGQDCACVERRGLAEVDPGCQAVSHSGRSSGRCSCADS